MKKLGFDVSDLSLAKKGSLKIEWAGQQMPVLRLIKKRFAKDKPLKGVSLAACLHVTSETANLMLTLQEGGAKLALCASNPLSTQDEVAACLAKDYGIAVFARKGEDHKTYYQHLEFALKGWPQITMDDGADLVNLLHKLEVKNSGGRFYIKGGKKEWEFYGSSEETTTGVIRLRAMEKDRALKVPVIAVNDSQTKYMFDNRYGTGQSSIDGILRATNLLLAGKNFVVAGYGWCGRGVAMRARGMGAQVIVCEVAPVRALEALMDGFQVMSLSRAALVGDIFITVTGDKNVLDRKHFLKMKDGAILANAGHFNVELNLAGLENLTKGKREIRPFLTEYGLKNGKRLYVLSEGRLVNLAAAEGHPAEVMDMSFSNQALAAEYFLKHQGSLKAKVYHLPPLLDEQVARLKLKAIGVKTDRLTSEQKKYLNSWQEGT